jgi:hypothetical protein
MKRWIWALVILPLLAAGDAPRLVYSKSFPGSTPAYVEITLDRNGEGQYKEAPNDDQPLKLRLSEQEVTQLFELAEKLGRFKNPLEAPVKVAFMGMKTFRFESGTEKNEVKFNFSEDLDARALQDWFERITETEMHLISLERVAKYDKLGVNKELLLLQSSFDRKRLVAPQQLLPMLDRIVKNESIMHMARLRASGLAEAIRATK